MDEKESILNSVKSLLGIKDPSMDAFDTDLILHINSAIATLTQIGVGPSSGFLISGPTESYKDFLGNDSKYQMVKTYLVHKVQLSWDPPQTSSLLSNLKEQIREEEYRLNMMVETMDKEDEQETEKQLTRFRMSRR